MLVFFSKQFMFTFMFFINLAFAYSTSCKRCEAGWYSPGGVSE